MEKQLIAGSHPPLADSKQEELSSAEAPDSFSSSDISVIIINYGTADLAISAVESVVTRSHGGRIVDVHVLDNGSPGDDAERLREAHVEGSWKSRVTLYLHDRNLGFGCGNNVVLQALSTRTSPPDYVFLLNPDARLDNEAIDILASILDQHSDAAAAGSAIVRPNGNAVTAAFRFPGIASEFVQTVNFGPLSRLFARVQVALPPELGRQEVDWVSGAAFLVRFPVMRAIGFFDPDFFLYFEETELMWRLRQTGRSIWYVPEARVEHEAGAATGMREGRHKTNSMPVYWYDSWRIYHVKVHGKAIARATALARICGASINVILQCLRGRSMNLPAGFFVDFFRHVLHPLFFGNPLQERSDCSALRNN